jgi:hypothetical protein
MLELRIGAPDNNKRKFILDKGFQYKYTWYLVTSIVGGSILFLLPAFYFVNQNYNLFTSLAFDTHPQLLQHLEREINWLRVFLLTSFLIMGGTTFFISLRMTRNLLNPLLMMEKHMHNLILGQWHIPDYQTNQHGDFLGLSLTYDYFYRALKANTEAELKMLEKLNIDQQNREAYAAWKYLVDNKRARLGIKEAPLSNESVADLNEFDQKRHAS